MLHDLIICTEMLGRGASSTASDGMSSRYAFFNGEIIFGLNYANDDSEMDFCFTI
jgi:hypothetical protein